MSGFEVLRSLRVSKVKTSILILSGLAGIEDKVRGLGFGADDYMTKPFHRNELVARIHAIVRRSKGHAQSVIQTGDLVVSLDTKTVEVDGARVHVDPQGISDAGTAFAAQEFEAAVVDLFAHQSRQRSTNFSVCRCRVLSASRCDIAVDTTCYERGSLGSLQ